MVATLYRKDKMSDVLIATNSFSCDLEGIPTSVTEGVTRVRANHPLAIQNPEYFKPVDEGVHFDVEETVAAPGVPRSQKPARKTAKKSGE
jgi:hypothetical protein